MNFYKKLLVFVWLFGGFASQSQAQITFSGHLNTAFPVSNWRNNYGAGFGAGAKFGYHFTDIFALKIAGDYIQFGHQDTRLIQKSKLPLHVTGEFNFKLGKFTPFVGIGAGIVFQRDVPIGFRRKFTTFGASATGGLNFDVSERTFLQIQTRFLWDNDSPMQTISLGFGAKL